MVKCNFLANERNYWQFCLGFINFSQPKDSEFIGKIIFKKMIKNEKDSANKK